MRERREDIKELTRFHIDKFCDRYGLPSKGFSPEFLDTLSSYSWPGNVREFVNTLDRTLASAHFEQTLFPKHLPSQIRVQVAQSALESAPDSLSSAEPAHVQHLPKLQEFRDSVYAQAEQQYLRDLMAVSATDIADACRISGLSQSRLYALLKKYQISRQS